MGQFNVVRTEIEGLYIIEPKVYDDTRGYFYESYNQKLFSEVGLNMTFVQDNESKSRRGVLRGLHFQTKHPQGKLVRVTQGEVWDVAVDLREHSDTYGKWVGVYLSEQNKKQFYIPEGFAHGFLVLSDIAIFNYKCTDFYDPSDQDGVLWNDVDLNISWPLDEEMEVLLSEKDQALKSLKELKK